MLPLLEVATGSGASQSFRFRTAGGASAAPISCQSHSPANLNPPQSIFQLGLHQQVERQPGDLTGKYQISVIRHRDLVADQRDLGGAEALVDLPHNHQPVRSAARFQRLCNPELARSRRSRPVVLHLRPRPLDEISAGFGEPPWQPCRVPAH
jgi:hypothetical protein